MAAPEFSHLKLRIHEVKKGLEHIEELISEFESRPNTSAHLQRCIREARMKVQHVEGLLSDFFFDEVRARARSDSERVVRVERSCERLLCVPCLDLKLEPATSAAPSWMMACAPGRRFSVTCEHEHVTEFEVV